MRRSLQFGVLAASALVAVACGIAKALVVEQDRTTT
jgi:hypothetical protein